MLYKRDINSLKSKYVKELFARDDEALSAALQSIPEHNLRPINLGGEEAKLVQILIKLHGAKKVIEVGTLVGYSTIWIARGIPDDGKLYSFEKEKNVADVAKKNITQSDVADKIEVLEGDAHVNLKTIENKGPFDAIFIDAEKSGYCKYLDWAEKHLRKGGLIIADNVFLFGQVYDESLRNEKSKKELQVMQEFNRRLADKDRYDSIIIANVEGLMVGLKGSDYEIFLLKRIAFQLLKPDLLKQDQQVVKI